MKERKVITTKWKRFLMFEVIFSPKSNKQIKELDDKTKKRIKEAILKIKENPWHKDTIKVKGYENIRRKRVGKFRILYFIDKKRKEILIIKIERRDEQTYKF